MNRPNITPESWHIGKRAGAEHGAIYGAKGEEIALPLGFFMDDQEAKANAQANAQAIASLPDLLAALEATLEQAEAHTETMTEKQFSESPWHPLWNQTRQALTKAGYTF